MSMDLNLDYYKVFYYTAKLGSLTLAAEKLSISQPAVSQSIKQLEKAFAVKLFYRTSKGVSLTSEGQILFSYVEKGYEQLMLGEKMLKQMKDMELGEIRIGASDMTLKYFLLPYLERFHEAYPKIKVLVTNAPTPKTLTFLKEGNIDFGVVSTPFAKVNDIDAVHVREIEDVFVAGRRFIQYRHRMLDFKELENLPLISLEGDTSTKGHMNEFLKQNGVVMHPEFELATSDMIVQFALRNLGVGSIVRDFAMEYIEQGKLFELRFNKMIPKRHFCVVTHTKRTLSTAAQSLMKDILEIPYHRDSV